MLCSKTFLKHFKNPKLEFDASNLISIFFIFADPLTSSVKPTKAYSRGSVVMVDEIMNASPSKFRFPEAGLRVMVTSHFGPKTRLRMASRLIITEVRTVVAVFKDNQISTGMC